MLEKGSLLDKTYKKVYFFKVGMENRENIRGVFLVTHSLHVKLKPKGLSHNLLSNNSFDDDVMMVSTNPTLNGTRTILIHWNLVFHS